MKIAVFVDVGYLYASCYRMALGENPENGRRDFDFDDAAALGALRGLVAELDGGGGSLVRIYWYDASPNYYPNNQHFKMSRFDDVKVRLGALRYESAGTLRQKGVDSLIVQDIVELAQHHAIDGAVLVSGDEDLLIGVTRAQSFGIRVHLLAIGPGSTAAMLRHESDVFHEWGVDTVRPWVTKRVPKEFLQKREHPDFPVRKIHWDLLINNLSSEFSLTAAQILWRFKQRRVQAKLYEKFKHLIQREIGHPLAAYQIHAALALFITELQQRTTAEAVT